MVAFRLWCQDFLSAEVQPRMTPCQLKRTAAAQLVLMASVCECIVPRCTVHGAESFHLWVHPHGEGGDCGLGVILCFLGY